MKPENIYKLISVGLILLSVLACNGTFTTKFPTATIPVPTQTVTVQAPITATLPYQVFVISTLDFHEVGPNTEYTINAQFPAVLDNNDPLALAFNDQMHMLVQVGIEAFKKIVSETPGNPGFAASSLEVKYNLIYQTPGIASIKFDFSGYISGAAHPYLYSTTANYHFYLGRNLSFEDVFRSDSNYLEVLSNYCIAQLRQRNIGFDKFSAGAAPTPENYRNWNLTREGLLITFDQYQVAPGAAGPQMVIVPFSALLNVLNREGPLG